MAYVQYGYVFLLAVVFPFICWGRLGHAGHPHAGPHFVFAAPPGMEAGAQSLSMSAARMGQNGHHSLEKTHTGPVDAAGQSIPDTLALFLIFLATASVVFRFYTPTRRSKRSHLLLGAEQDIPNLPTPPPRFA